MIRVAYMNGMGLIAQDVEVWSPGTGPTYRDLLNDQAAQAAAVVVFETFARARGVYDGEIEGDFGPKCEAAWQALMPGASGPTTTEMLDGLDALSAAAFRPLETRYALGIARDKYLATLGVRQYGPNPDAESSRYGLESGSEAWDPLRARSTEAYAETVPADDMAGDYGVDESAQVTEVGTTETTAAAAAGGAAPRRKWLAPVVVVVVLAAAGGVAWWAVKRSRRGSRRIVRQAA